MADPQWTVEFSVYDNRTKARREVRIDALDLADAVAGAISGIQSVLGSELSRGVRKLVSYAPSGFFSEIDEPASDPLSTSDLPSARTPLYAPDEGP